jgi:TonB-dependent SusC/RagA subfamily outer membrane receptor
MVRVKYNLPIKFSLSKRLTGATKTLKTEPKDALLQLGADQLALKGTDSDDGRSPLYIVDGEIIENNKISSIDSKNIETINILKEGSGTALYGEKAAKNGVVLITTKNAEKVVIGRPSKKQNQK